MKLLDETSGHLLLTKLIFFFFFVRRKEYLTNDFIGIFIDEKKLSLRIENSFNGSKMLRRTYFESTYKAEVYFEKSLFDFLRCVKKLFEKL